MEEDCYEKIDGRPLVYLFGGFHPEYIPRLRKACEARGLPHPFAVFFNSGGAAKPDTDYSVMDGVSNYACCGQNIDTYTDTADEMITLKRSAIILFFIKSSSETYQKRSIVRV